MITTAGAIIQSTTKQFESTTANPTRETESQGTAGVQSTTGILFGSSSTQRTSTNRPIISTSDSPLEKLHLQLEQLNNLHNQQAVLSLMERNLS